MNIILHGRVIGLQSIQDRCVDKRYRQMIDKDRWSYIDDIIY